MALFKNVLMGRPDGIRSGLRKRLFGGGAEDTSPNSAHSAPRDVAPPPAEAAVGLHPEAPKDVIPPGGFEVVLHKDALAPGKLAEIIIGGKAIVVANVDGSFYATHAKCPHADGPLGEGELEGSTLTCPYHGWKFDVTDGSCKTNGDEKVRTYDVQIVGDAVCVRL